MWTKILKAILATIVIALPFQALAEYPDKPVEFIVPWPPGDLEDVLTRMIADDFQAEYGVSAAVVNKPGGGGGPFPGAIEAALAPADGYTIGSFVMSVVAVGPTIGIPELNPNPFEPLGAFVTYPFIIAVAGDAPYDDLEQLAAHSQANAVVLGHFGKPFMPTRVTLALANKMGITFEAEAAFDSLDCNTLASGDADVINTTVQLVLPCLDDIKVLASIGSERLDITPEARTISEIVPELDVSLWNGLFVHKDTPAEVREKIIAVARKTMMSDAAIKLAANTGAQIYWLDAQDTTAQIVKDIETLNVINKLVE